MPSDIPNVEHMPTDPYALGYLMKQMVHSPEQRYGDMFDRLQENVGSEEARRIWSKACDYFDSLHEGEE